MRSHFWIQFLTWLAILSMMLAACTPSTPEADKQNEVNEIPIRERGKVVGISLPTDASDRWVADGELMEESLSALGYAVNLKYASNKSKTQQAQLQEMLTEGVNILVITPVEGADLSNLLKAAHESGVLVIAYDQLIMQTADVDFFATFNHFEAGVLQARQLEQALGLAEGKGPYNFELFAGTPLDSSSQFCYEGSLSILQPYITKGQLVILSGELEIEEVAITNGDEVTAQVRMRELLNTNYKHSLVDVILSPSDSVSQGILMALKKAGYGTESKPWPILAGQDADIQSMKALIAGEQAFTIFKDNRELVKQTVNMVHAVLQGQTVPVNNTQTYHNGIKFVPSYEVSPVSIDIHNYAETIIESGYLTPDQLNLPSEK